MSGENRIAAGFKWAFYGVNNADGLMIGNTLAGAVSGSATGQPMKRLVGARTIPVGLPEPEILTVTGDNEPLVSFEFESAELPSGILELAVRDQTFEALVQGTGEATYGNVNFGIYGPSGTVKPSMALMLMREAKKYEGNTKGAAAFEGIFIPNCTIVPLFTDITQREFGPYRFSINLSKSSRYPFGPTLTELVHKTTEGSIFPFESDNPLMVEVWQGDASRTAFTLTYTPAVPGTLLATKNNGIVDPGRTVSGLTVTYPVAPVLSQYAYAMYEVAGSDL